MLLKRGVPCVRFFADKPFEWWTLHGGEKVGDRYYVLSRSYEDVDEAAETISMPELPDYSPSLLQVAIS